MNEKGIYRIVVRHKNGQTLVAVQSRSPRGTPYTTDSVKLNTRGVGKAERKHLVAAAIVELTGPSAQS